MSYATTEDLKQYGISSEIFADDPILAPGRCYYCGRSGAQAPRTGAPRVCADLNCQRLPFEPFEPRAKTFVSSGDGITISGTIKPVEPWEAYSYSGPDRALASFRDYEADAMLQYFEKAMPKDSQGDLLCLYCYKVVAFVDAMVVSQRGAPVLLCSNCARRQRP